MSNPIQLLPVVPVYNAGSVTVPAYGVLIQSKTKTVSATNNSVVSNVFSLSGNDENNGSGTFATPAHYHNRLGFSSGAPIIAEGYGDAIFDLKSAPIKAATESDDITEGDILIATSDHARLKKLDGGTAGNPGDYTNIFGMFVAMRRSSANVYQVSWIEDPVWTATTLEAATAGEPIVAELVQQGSLASSSLRKSVLTSKNMTFFADADLETDADITIGLRAGAIVLIRGATETSGGGGGSSAACSCDATVTGVVYIDGFTHPFAYRYTVDLTGKTDHTFLDGAFTLTYDAEIGYWVSEDIEEECETEDADPYTETGAVYRIVLGPTDLLALEA